MTRANVQPTQQAQVAMLSGTPGNPANVVRVAGILHCAACGDATHFDPQTGAHEAVWCEVCNPRPVEDQIPF